MTFHVQSTLSGWAVVAALAIGSGLAVLGVYLPNGAPLLTLGGTVTGGVLALLQANRPTNARTRASDRLPTAPAGVPILATEPPEELTPVRRGRE